MQPVHHDDVAAFHQHWVSALHVERFFCCSDSEIYTQLSPERHGSLCSKPVGTWASLYQSLLSDLQIVTFNSFLLPLKMPIRHWHFGQILHFERHSVSGLHFGRELLWTASVIPWRTGQLSHRRKIGAERVILCISASGDS
jgi:hypothetical protein